MHRMKDYVSKNYESNFSRVRVKSMLKKAIRQEVDEDEEKQKLLARFIEKELTQEEKKRLKREIRNQKFKESQMGGNSNPMFAIAKNFLHKKKGTCRTQILRSSCAWSTGIRTVEHSILNAYIRFIRKAQKFIYIENQFLMSNGSAGGIIENGITKAIKNRIVKAHKRKEPFKVYIFIPLMPGFEGDILEDGSQVLKLQIKFQLDTIVKGNTSLFQLLMRERIDASEYVTFFGLRQHDVFDDGPKTEMIYIHSKLLVVDDRYTIIGSANINDRSMLGSRDSEVCICVEDEDMVEVDMGGEPFKVGRINHEFRKKVMSGKSINS